MLTTCVTDGTSSLVDSPEGQRRIPRKRKAGVKSAASFTPQQVEARWQAYQAKLARPDMQQLSATRASLPIASYRCALPLPAANKKLLTHSCMHSCIHAPIQSCVRLLAHAFFHVFVCSYLWIYLFLSLNVHSFFACLPLGSEITLLGGFLYKVLWRFSVPSKLCHHTLPCLPS